MEATAYGARLIVERFREEGVPIKEVIAIGGVPKKAPFVMQVLADVLDMDIKVAKSEQTVALGAAMFAATAAGLFPLGDGSAEGHGQRFRHRVQP